MLSKSILPTETNVGCGLVLRYNMFGYNNYKIISILAYVELRNGKV